MTEWRLQLPLGRLPQRLRTMFGAMRTYRRGWADPERASAPDSKLGGALLRIMAAATQGLIYAKDIDGRFLFANPVALVVIGRSWAEIAGKTDAEILIDAHEAREVMAHDRRIMNAGVAETVEEELTLADGRATIWLSTKAPLCTEDGVVIGIMGMSIDITGRKQDEARLRDLEAQLASHSRQRAMDRLSLALTREINQPLATVMNHLSIAEHMVGAEQAIDRNGLLERIRLASQHTMRSGEIVKQLRAFAGQVSDMRVQPVGPVVRDAVDILSPRLVHRGIAVELTISDEDMRACIDRIQVQQAIVALLDGAIGRLPIDDAPHRVSICLYRDAELVLLAAQADRPDEDIARQGPGQADRPLADFDLDDVGQAFGRRIIEDHGGTLSYLAGPGVAFRVSASLPAM
jgi:PAS domain S-box-containing protein